MSDWLRSAGGILNFCAAYFTTQLVHCAAVSFLLVGFVMLLRETLFSKRAFLRGMLWLLFLPVPFVGKLKLFYENEAVRKVTWRLTAIPMSFRRIDYMYMAGILAAVIWIFRKRLRLRRTIAEMKTVSLQNIQVRVTDMNITPFTAGLLQPQIVLPQAMVGSYSRDELEAVIRHEQTHIRLGHLWFGFAWDLLRCLLWINPFLSAFQKYLRSDMEDICDRVCIQNSGRTAYEYGRVLLKSLKLLRCGQEGIPPAATYAGERDFARMKRRMDKIAGFRPYRSGLCKGMAAAAFLAAAVLLLLIHTHSYARYSDNKDVVLVYQYNPGSREAAVVSCDSERLGRMIAFDDSFVYVEREAFEDFLYQNHVEGEIFIVFGGYDKLPGLGGAAESCCYENSFRSSKDEIVRISYKSIRDCWEHALCKML